MTSPLGPKPDGSHLKESYYSLEQLEEREKKLGIKPKELGIKPLNKKVEDVGKKAVSSETVAKEPIINIGKGIIQRCMKRVKDVENDIKEIEGEIETGKNSSKENQEWLKDLKVELKKHKDQLAEMKDKYPSEYLEVVKEAANNKSSSKSELKEKVERFVWAFLQPYIQGKITKERDDPNRKAMIDLIFEKFNVDPSQRQEIEKMAKDEYIKIGVKGFLGVLHQDTKIGVPVRDDSIKHLYRALKEGLSKDFPGTDFPHLKHQIDVVYQFEENEKQKAEAEVGHENISRQRAVLRKGNTRRGEVTEKLRKTGKRFLDKPLE